MSERLDQIVRRTFYKAAEDCPDVVKHTPCPSGYVAWHEWAEKKGKTHDSTRCPTCGFYTIWKPKPRRKSA